MIHEHIRNNVVGYVAVFLALTGTAMALPGKNTVDSGDIKAQNVKSADLKDGAVTEAKIADNGVTSPKIAPDAVGGTDVADNALTGADIDESTLQGLGGGGGGGTPTGSAGGDLSGTYPNPSIAAGAVGTGEVADNALTGTDIDESSLSGVALAGSGVGGSVACCQLQAQHFDTSVAYNAGNPVTFVDIGDIELRSLASPALGQFAVCSTVVVSRGVFVYTGGSDGSTTDTRALITAPALGCSAPVDINAAQVTGRGDFRLISGVDEAVVQGFNDGNGGQLSVLTTSF